MTATADSTPATAAGPGRRRSTVRRHRAPFGSTRQLPSGRWQARYSDPTGNRFTAPQTFARRGDAHDWLATVRADMVRGTWRAPDLGTVTLNDYLRDYLASRLDLAPSTRALYERLGRVWLCVALDYPPAPSRRPRTVDLGGMQLRTLSVTVVREWHAAALHTAATQTADRATRSALYRREHAAHAARAWAREHGYRVKDTGRLPAEVIAAWRAAGSPAAQLHAEADRAARPVDHAEKASGRVQVTHAYRLLRLVLQSAVREGLLDANPCQIAGAGTVKAKERVPATPAQIVTLAAAVPARYSAAVHVAAWSGLRAGELFGLARRHVDLEAGTVRVERAVVELPGQPAHFGPPKTASSRRTVHLPAHVVQLLAEHLAVFTGPDADALVFTAPDGQPVGRAVRTRMFRRACAVVGRPDLRWHDLRHTGATMAAQAGASIRELQHRLGHSTFAAAMLYQHGSAERDRELAGRLGALALLPTENTTTNSSITDPSNCSN